MDQYSIFDVIMPLPGKDVDFPGGALGERYKDFLRRDGLDPGNFVRKQKSALHIAHRLDDSTDNTHAEITRWVDLTARSYIYPKSCRGVP